MRYSLLLVFLLAACPAWGGWAASPVATQSVDSLSERSQVSLVTILPGDLIYTEFGHSAFRVYDPAQGIDRLYNYGTFDFDAPFFVPKFMYGRLTYFLSVASYPGALQHYRNYGRPVIEQVLDLTLEQREALFRFLQTNARPENRFYRYDFLFDNCSTRIRDALEQALGPVLHFPPRPDPNQSFRHLLDPYVADRPLLDFGFDLGLGTPADQIATPRETMFLPEYMMRAASYATLTADGTTRPLVARTDTVVWLPSYDATERVFDWPVALAWLLFAAGLGGTIWGAYHQQLPRQTSRAVGDALLFLVAGIVGLVLLFLWVVSEHAVTDSNWNVAWAWPTHLAAAYAFWKRPPLQPWMRSYLLATAVVTGVLILGWPLWPQDLHAATFPLVLLLTVRAGWHVYTAARSLQQKEVPAA